MTDEEYGVEGLDVDTEYKEPEVVKDQNPHTLKVVQAPELRDVEITKGDNAGTTAKIVDILLRVTDTELENPKLVKYSLWLPKKNDPKDKQNASLGRIIKFVTACGNTEVADAVRSGKVSAFVSALGEFVGAEIQATLKIEESAEYGDSNVIKRIIA